MADISISRAAGVGFLALHLVLIKICCCGEHSSDAALQGDIYLL